MAKQTRSRPGQNKRAAARAAAAAPYDKSKPRAKPTKPTVQVTYEGAPKAGKPKPKVVAKAAEIRARDEAKKEEKRERRKEKKREAKAEGKGKGKAVVEESDDEDEDEDVDEDDIEIDADAEVDVATRAAVDASSPTFKIVAGTYEKLLYGLEGRYAPGATKPTLEPIFIFPAHLATVKAVAASPGGKWLATGSEDEFVKVWDLRRRKEVGSLSQHTGSITSLTFPTPSHLLTTSDDATLSLFRTSDWALLKSLKGHSGRVNNVDVHPTGRVALSVGKDQTLKMWDLMRGRGAASLALGSEAELVKFSPRGTHFAVLYPKKVEIYSLILKLLHTLETKFRFNALVFADLPHPEDDEEEDATEVLCIGTEKGVVEVYRVSLGEDEEVEEEKDGDEDSDEPMDADAETSKSSAVVQRIATLSGHTNRIKSISTLRFAAPHGPTVLLATVSSDGLINLYDLADVDVPDSDEDEAEVEAQVEEIEPVASYDTKASRLICVTLADGPVPRASKLVTGVKAKEETGRRATFAVPDDKDEDEEDEEDDDEDEDGHMYENSDEEEGDGMEVEFEDEEEEEEEDEGEFEDE